MAAPRRINWDQQPLGKMSDRKLAEKLGVGRTSVSCQRKSRGLPFVKGGIDWDQQPLGCVPDSELARDLGVSHHLVYGARRRRGVLLDVQRACPCGKEFKANNHNAFRQRFCSRQCLDAATFGTRYHGGGKEMHQIYIALGNLRRAIEDAKGKEAP